MEHKELTQKEIDANTYELVINVYTNKRRDPEVDLIAASTRVISWDKVKKIIEIANAQ
jgi:hypothetical protein